MLNSFGTLHVDHMWLCDCKSPRDSKGYCYTAIPTLWKGTISLKCWKTRARRLQLKARKRNSFLLSGVWRIRARSILVHDADSFRVHGLTLRPRNKWERVRCRARNKFFFKVKEIILSRGRTDAPNRNFYNLHLRTSHFYTSLVIYSTSVNNNMEFARSSSKLNNARA